jgi:hypothetical protein
VSVSVSVGVVHRGCGSDRSRRRLRMQR